MAIREYLRLKGVSQTEVAEALGMQLPTLSRKLNGKRPLSLEQANQVLGFLRSRVGDGALTLDQLFGSSPPKRVRRKAA